MRPSDEDVRRGTRQRIRQTRTSDGGTKKQKTTGMTLAHDQIKMNGNRLFIAAFILWPICFSCRAQTIVPSVFKTAEGSPIGMNCGPGNLVAGDVNKDGKADVVIACGDNRTLTLFKGRGDGQFDVSSGSPLLLPYAPNEIVIGDMNNDGYADLVVGSHDSYSIMILRGDGKGNFSTASSDSVIMRNGSHPHTHGLGVADFNGDGLTDIVTANSSDNDISVMLNNGRTGFRAAPGSPFTVGPAPYPLTIGDVNNDKHLDIVSTSTHLSTRALTVLMGDGHGNFLRRDLALRTANPWFVAVADIDKDKFPDLVSTHSERSELTVLIGSNTGDFTEVRSSPFDLGNSAWHVAIADVNRDGNPDVLAAANNGVRLMLGDGKGQFSPAPGSPFLTGKGTWHLAIVDVNGDGLADVVTSNLESKNVSVLLGK
jgi:FG-GAP-like repeat